MHLYLIKQKFHTAFRRLKYVKKQYWARFKEK